MNDSAAMGSAIWGRLGTVTYTYSTAGGTATTSGSVGVYDTLAPQGQNAPYLTFQIMDSIDQYVFGTVSGESSDYLVKAISNRQFPSPQAYQIIDQAHAALQDATLTIVGSYPMRVRRISRVAPYRDNDGYWHVGYLYRIDRWNT